MDYTTAALVERVQRIATIPPAAPGFDTDIILDILNDEMESFIVPFLLGLKNEYLLSHTDYTLDSTGLVAVPSAAIGGIVRSVKILDSSDVEYSMPDISVEDNNSQWEGCFFTGNKIGVTNPGQSVGKILRVYYFRQPSELIIDTDARQIISRTGDDVTLSNLPSAWSATGFTLDAIKGDPQFDILDESLTFTELSSVLSIPGLAADVSDGDWLAPAGQSPIPCIPYVVFPLLAQSAAIKVMESFPDTPGLSASQKRLDKMIVDISDMMKRRNAGRNKVIKPKNGLFERFM